MSGERRTRSQLVVPDHIMATANVSPYKQARQAVKQHPMTARKLQADNTDETVLATDVGTSEQLGQGTSSKRSASPEASEDRVTALEEREIKRAKLQGMSLDGQDVNGDAEVPERAPHSPGTKGKSHGRHASEPNPPRPFAGPSEETRARSVPLLFPAVPKSPKIDFVSLHRESPTRAQRFPEFRIQTLFPQPEEPKLSVPMQVDIEEPRPTPASPLSTPDVTTASRSRTPLVLNIEIPPSSPMSKSDLLAELSPLSSVPDTSFEQETSGGEELTPVPTPRAPEPTRPPSRNDQSRLPKPPKLVQSIRADASSSKPKPIAKQADKVKSQKKGPNAFTTMMTASRALGNKAPAIMKGKGKGKMQSSSQSNIANATSTTQSQPSGSKTQPSVKSKMKARTKTTSAPSRPLRPPNSDEEENVQTAEDNNQETRPSFSAVVDAPAPPTPYLEEEKAVGSVDMDVVESNPVPNISIVEEPIKHHHNNDVAETLMLDPILPSPQVPASEEILVEPITLTDSMAAEPQGESEPAPIAEQPVQAKASLTSPMKAPRLTRSTSVKRKADGPAQPAQQKKKVAPFAMPKTPVEPTTTNPNEDPLSELSDYPEESDREKSSTQAAVLASSSKLASFARPTAASLARTPAKPAQRSPQKQMIVASPLKLARSGTELHSERNGSPKKLLYGAGTSLDKLTRALQKVRRPLPPRPNTTLGFNDAKQSSESSTTTNAEPSAGPSKMSGLGLGFPTATTLQRSASADARNMPPPPPPASNVRPNIFSGKTSVLRGGSSGMRGRVGPKASTKSSLPMVPGSPVKGGGLAARNNDSMEEDLESTHLHDDAVGPSELLPTPSSVLDQDGDIVMSEVVSAGNSSSGKERDTSNDWLKGSSRRTSMAARALSMSVNALPQSPSPEPEPEVARTPPTRRGGLRSSNNPQPSSSGSAEPSTSSRQKAPKVRGLSVLKDCRVYVDIRDESGNDTGEYFVNMLKLLGAKVMSSVGSTCTHIVYRNGVAGTIKKYHLLEDKPLVVGMAWVADCAERQSHVDEKEYLVDLDDIEPIQQKRRRSMLPKFVDFNWDSTPGDADVSMESAVSVDDDIPPLERARQRARQLAASSS